MRPREFTYKELLFLKAIITHLNRTIINADPVFGEADCRSIQPYDVDQFTFVWDVDIHHTSIVNNRSVIRVPCPKGYFQPDMGTLIISKCVEILYVMAESLVIRKSPVIGRLNKLVYNSRPIYTDLHYKLTRIMMKLKAAYEIVMSSWSDHGPLSHDIDAITAGRVKYGDIMYTAEELYTQMQGE